MNEYAKALEKHVSFIHGKLPRLGSKDRSEAVEKFRKVSAAAEGLPPRVLDVCTAQIAHLLDLANAAQAESQRN